MSYQAQTWVDEVGVDLCKNGGEAFVLLRIANHCNPNLRGAYPSSATLARLCKMGRSTVLKHIRELAARRVILPGDSALTDHLPADKRPPVYDLAGGHEEGCAGGHTISQQCRTTAGAQIEHPSTSAPRAGARSEHPPKKRRSAGARSEHSTPAGVQIETERVLKSSTKSSKELNLSPSGIGSGGSRQTAPELQPEEQEREIMASPTNNASLPTQRLAPQRDRSAEAPVTAVTGVAEQDLVRVADAYVSRCGAYPLPPVVQRVRDDAAKLLGRNWPVDHVVRLAAELPKWGTDLMRHAEHNLPPAAASTAAAPSRAALIAACRTCDEYGFVSVDGRERVCKHPDVDRTTAA